MIMDPYKKFREYILVESKDSVYLSKINEMTELPNFSETDKEILEFMSDRTDLIEVGVEAGEVSDYLLNHDYFVDPGYIEEGKDFLNRAGGLEALELVMERSRDYDMIDSVARDISKAEWDKVARLYAYYRGEELLLASEILAELYANEEGVTEQDIKNLERELKLFIRRG